MSTWNKRATQGALIRLDQSGMIKRRRIRKKQSTDAWVTCIQVLRAPTDEDMKNLGFRRTATLADESAAEPLDDNADGDSVMKDFEDDMLDDAETTIDAQANAPAVDKPEVIPPQWTPDRFLPNIVFDAVALGGPRGWDAETLRDRIVGPFWRRPMESYFSRMTNDWEKTQPIHLRHLSVIRDQGVTDEKKFLHYVYRTYANFEKAVELHYAHWEGVANFEPNEPLDPASNGAVLDAWGFPIIKPENLVRGSGSATLSDAGSAVMKPRKYGSRWDTALAQEIGYKKYSSAVPKVKSSRGVGRPKKPKVVKEKPVKVAKEPKPRKSNSGLLLTSEEKMALGLDPNVRLSKKVRAQILAHRQMTGDPTSLPDTVEHGQAKRQLSVPLMTKEERVAAGLSARGRLGIEQENKIREQRGLPKLVKKEKKRATKFSKEPTLLSKQQRKALGWKDHGRLPQDLIEGLRQERAEGIALEDSKVIAKYMDVMRAKVLTPKTPNKASRSSQETTVTSQEPEDPLENREAEQMSRTISTEPHLSEISLPHSVSGKRKADIPVAAPASTKKRRIATKTRQDSNSLPLSPMASSPADITYIPESGTPSVIHGVHDTGDTISSIVSRVIKPAEATPPPSEGPILPTVEAQPPPKPPVKTYLPLDNSQLDARAQAAFDQYKKRSSPGLYVNPYMKQKVARGRPRKAMIATFKLPSLAELDWFEAETAPEQSTNRDDVAHTSDTTQTTTAHRVDEVIPSRKASHPSEPETSRAGMQMQSDRETHQNIQNYTPPPSIADKPASVEPEGLPTTSENCTDVPIEPEEQPIASEDITEIPIELQEPPTAGGKSTEVPIEPATDSVAASQEVETVVSPPAGPDPSQSKSQSEIVSDMVRKQSPRPVPSLSRMVGGWTPINASERSRTSPYQSPYATSPAPENHVAQQTADTTHANGVPAPSADGSRGTASKADDDQTLPDGVHSAIVEAPVPPVPGTKPRIKEPGKGGSQRHFRQQVILDIIKRCNGVFPGGGEILRPFLTIWRERHSNIKEPSLSTISETLRSMASRPEFGLKHWNFAAQNKNTPGTTTRRMFTWAHLNERSPEVLKLAHNMAQYSHQKEHSARVSEKSLLYYPEEIRDLIGEVVSYQPIQAAPKDDSIVLNRMNPDLEKQINEAKQRRRSELNKQKRLEVKARKVQDARVEQALSKQAPESGGAPRGKRARLASLNDKSKHLRRAPLYTADIGALGEESDDAETGGPDVGAAEKPGQISLVWTRPIGAPVPEREPVPNGEQSEDEESEDEPADEDVNTQDPCSVAEPVEEHALNGVMTVASQPTGANNDEPELPGAEPTDPSDQAATAEKGKKRVRIAAPRDQPSQKRVRLVPTTTKSSQDDVYTPQHSSDEDTQSASQTEDEGEENGETLMRKTKKRDVRTSHSRQRGKPGPPPTLLERLTGLTGDPNDPVYQPPQGAPKPDVTSRPWTDKKKIRLNRSKKELQYTKKVEQADEFKKLFCTFAVACSLSGEDGMVDWNIVKSVYANDKTFDLNRARKLWAWMQTRMAKQVDELTVSFQSLYLEAYETGKVAAIEDPQTYDWAGLVRWTTRKCAYPELPLPTLREALQKFAVQESSYETLDRVTWYKATTADRTRTMLQLQYSFTAPLHRSRNATWSSEDKLLKARSWIRANTATPQTLYDANLAHEKFKDLGESVLVSVVGSLVEKQHLRMRKLKRLLPGRNYNFTQALAKKYARLFQLDDFLKAVEVKKKMDTAFASEDPKTRSYNISRCEEDSVFAAIMTMVTEGTVKLIPQLPPINNDFKAPLPKLSVWGFCEGGYNHRAIDRSRLFWDIHVVPTEKYKFGNPLQTLSSPTLPKDNQENASWQALPEPPLPGKDDSRALLPIWSSIDGQHVTWPWWYRVLNLVLQPLIFMAGATAADVHSHCPDNTTELFEVELVLGWLESVGAVKKTVGGGYITLPCFWAVFGDELHDTANDWFGEHVKGKPKNHEKQRWRLDYNLRHSTLQAHTTQRAGTTSAMDEEGHTNTADAGAVETHTSRQILKNPSQQYRIVQQALDAQPPQEHQDRSDTVVTNSSAATKEVEQSPPTETTKKSDEDTEMADANMDAEFDEDVDAEGEIDDDVY